LDADRRVDLERITRERSQFEAAMERKRMEAALLAAPSASPPPEADAKSKQTAPQAHSKDFGTTAAFVSKEHRLATRIQSRARGRMARTESFYLQLEQEEEEMRDEMVHEEDEAFFTALSQAAGAELDSDEWEEPEPDEWEEPEQPVAATSPSRGGRAAGDNQGSAPLDADRRVDLERITRERSQFEAVMERKRMEAALPMPTSGREPGVDGSARNQKEQLVVEQERLAQACAIEENPVRRAQLAIARARTAGSLHAMVEKEALREGSSRSLATSGSKRSILETQPVLFAVEPVLEGNGSDFGAFGQITVVQENTSSQGRERPVANAHASSKQHSFDSAGSSAGNGTRLGSGQVDSAPYATYHNDQLQELVKLQAAFRGKMGRDETFYAGGVPQ